MSRKYDNFCKCLQPYNISVITTKDEFVALCKVKNDPSLLMKCCNGHSFSITSIGLYKKLGECEKGTKQMCAECKKPTISGEELSCRARCKELGFKFISWRDRNVEYQCVCGNITTTNSHNILKKERQAQCSKCQNNKNRKPIDEVKKMFKDAGCELLSEYTSKDTPVKYRCVCGNVAEIRTSDFKKGKRCMIKCKSQKYKETCQKTYGTDNAFQAESIKKKIRDTCKERYGVEHCMQSPEIFSKSLKTAFHKFKKLTYDDEYEWIVQGYEPDCIWDLMELYDPSDIIAGKNADVPTVKYIYNGKNKVWHPDIFIPSANKLFEVKSTWTYTKAPKQMAAKMEHCKYDCELRIYNKNGTIFEAVSRNCKTGKLKYMFGNKMILGEPL